MNLINEWFQRRRQELRKSKHNAGFDFALGAMARGEETPLTLKSRGLQEYSDAFDIGIDNAIELAIELKIVKDDRI